MTVLFLEHVGIEHVAALLSKYCIDLHLIERGAEIPGSYWGESEAGLIGNVLFARADTPVHSVLHEACHFICMTAARRTKLNRDAGGDYHEENAVCYLQIVLGDCLTACTSELIMRDMDSWGYTFRLGSTRAWFEQDASDAREWLMREEVIDEQGRPTWKVNSKQ